MYMRVDEAGNEIAAGAVDALRIRAGVRLRSNRDNAAITDDHVRVWQRSCPLRRNQRDILDHYALINNAVGVRRRPNIQSDTRTQCLRQ